MTLFMSAGHSFGGRRLHAPQAVRRAVAARIVFIVLPFSIVGVIAVHAVVFRPRMRNLNIIAQVPPTASLA
jgi:hypothetical protein